MSTSVGASSSSALSYLQQLMQQGSAKDTKKAASTDPLSMLLQAVSGGEESSGQANATAPSAISGGGATCPQFSSGTMSALLSLQGDQAADSPSAKLFAKLDADGDGTISKGEFSSAASKAGADSAVADAVYAKIDGDGDGSISQAELTKADHGPRHHHHGVGGPGGPPPGAGGAQDPLEAMLSDAASSGATTKTSTNADGSTTTTISYADGSKIDLTTAAATSNDSGTANGNSSNAKFNLLEQLIKLQSQMLTAATSTVSALV